ncbi:acyl carrier protein phosphodiesterase [Aureibacter tunicatorum]|uniref:Acyl carrier protein phosphodiesterase n=1 Tax=Aureibacter tunicatorum TaxID=866807 RepID=A0AAE3XMZ9_9BACT|nr:ACP phosphodiesterase [Aureibacter tunicatorum]MDR6239452.1 acyl carrier protein phosphodiesterase [Aureibacter tunicatorum]BDD04625.1 ACP phosphodiesterase [Aureibacter tunicatorum]
MNILSHLYLSKPTDQMFGNFIGDFVKGKQYMQYSKSIQEGILYHRAIDEYTDNHIITKDCKRKISKYLGHFSGVAVDLYFDHFLAKKFHLYSDKSLTQYLDDCQLHLANYKNLMPDGAILVFKGAFENQWILKYQTLQGMHESLRGIGRRTRFDNNLLEASRILLDNYEFFESSHHSFWQSINQEKSTLISNSKK